MYCQSFFVISVRGIGLVPTTADSSASGCFGAMNAAFGLRFAPPFFAAFLAFFAPPFLAPPFFAPPFLAAFFPFFAAILSPGRWNGWGCSLEGNPVFPMKTECLRGRKVYPSAQDAIGK